MYTDVKIASNALVLIGDEPITSFSDSGAGAKAANELYLPTKREFLSSHPWTWCTKSQRLNVLSQTPDTLRNMKYALQLPTDMLRLWRILPLGTHYEIEGTILFSNSNQLLASYSYDVLEAYIPDIAETALEFLLASKLAISVTESTSRSEDMLLKYERAAAIAMSVDSQQQPQIQIMDSPWTDVRYNGFDYWG